MSVLGQKRTFRNAAAMSALPPKAHIGLLLLALFLPPIIPLIGTFRMPALPPRFMLKLMLALQLYLAIRLLLLSTTHSGRVCL